MAKQRSKYWPINAQNEWYKFSAADRSHCEFNTRFNNVSLFYENTNILRNIPRCLSTFKSLWKNILRKTTRWKRFSSLNFDSDTGT